MRTTSPSMMMTALLVWALSFQQQQQHVLAFTTLVPTTHTLQSPVLSIRYQDMALQAVGDNKKRKRKRKSSDTTTSSSSAAVSSSPPPLVAPVSLPPQQLQQEEDDDDEYEDDDDDDDDDEPTTTSSSSSATLVANLPPIAAKEQNLIDKIAQLQAKTKGTATADVQGEDGGFVDDFSDADSADLTAIPLPDIQTVLKQKKAFQQELERMERDEETAEDNRPARIKRTDKEAFRKLLEQQPYSDADDSFFEEEAYGTVSALLAERAQPFLGIPSGPLQVGHFMGALGIVLMAFVEYPGFPLTNLPSAVREALQGGLACIYAINFVLALYVSVIGGVAKDRGQSPILWGTKTLVVGGLALDQVTQLPTLAQIAEAEARKGKRALKKNKNKNK